jgi:DNA polymerase III gamma/tau subunit
MDCNQNASSLRQARRNKAELLAEHCRLISMNCDYAVHMLDDGADPTVALEYAADFIENNAHVVKMLVALGAKCKPKTFCDVVGEWDVLHVETVQHLAGALESETKRHTLDKALECAKVRQDHAVTAFLEHELAVST